MSSRSDRWFQTGMQLAAILGLVLIFAVIAHKGFHDITRLAREHSGGDFWLALVRYLFKNLAGG